MGVRATHNAQLQQQIEEFCGTDPHTRLAPAAIFWCREPQAVPAVPGAEP
jgi:hypothetical protein